MLTAVGYNRAAIIERRIYTWTQTHMRIFRDLWRWTNPHTWQVLSKILPLMWESNILDHLVHLGFHFITTESFQPGIKVDVLLHCQPRKVEIISLITKESIPASVNCSFLSDLICFTSISAEYLTLPDTLININECNLQALSHNHDVGLVCWDRQKSKWL